MHAGHHQDGIEAADDCDADKADRVIDPHDAGHEIRAEKGPERAYQAELERNHHQKQRKGDAASQIVFPEHK